MNKQPISNLDGYLHSLRRLSGNSCDFWAEIFEFENDITEGFKEYLADREVLIIDSYPVGYKEIDEILEEAVFTKLQVQDESLLKLFAWDIVDYLQLSYQLIQPEIDPISSKESLLFNAKSEFHGDYVYIVVPVKNHAIAMGLASRA